MKLRKTLPLLGTLCSLFAAAPAFAAAPSYDGYLTDSRGELVRSGAGLCWRTSSWTPEKGVEECGDAPSPVTAPAVVAPRTPAPVVVQQQRREVTLRAEALFPFDHWRLTPKGVSIVDEFAAKLSRIDYNVVIVVGHTDSIGSDSYNQILSEKRAAAVKSRLVEKGVPAANVQVVGKGEKEPVASNKTRDGRQQNRRAVIEAFGLERP